jgi:hypothetical protein
LCEGSLGQAVPLVLQFYVRDGIAYLTVEYLRGTVVAISAKPLDARRLLQ